MGQVRSCPVCTNRKCLPNREKLPPKGSTSSEGLPAPLLRKKLHDAAVVTEHIDLDLAEGHLDVSTAGALLHTLDMLAFQSVVAQACVISAITALETSMAEAQEVSAMSLTGGCDDMAAEVVRQSYQGIQVEALECVEKIGGLFKALMPSFHEHAFPLTGSVRDWGSRPMNVGEVAAPSTGTGYLNSFQDERLLEPAARCEAFTTRLQCFLDGGGSLTDIVEFNTKSIVDFDKDTRSASVSSGMFPDSSPVSPGPNSRLNSGFDGGAHEEAWRSLVPGQPYDYVVHLDHTIRCYPTAAAARGKRPKCGHSILAGPSHDATTFRDDPVVMAGDLCVLKNSEGCVEVLILTNNSGHFKCAAADLPNAVAAFMKAGIHENNICLYRGPNNVLALLNDLKMAQGTSVGDLAHIVAGEELLNPYTMVSQWEKQR